MSRGACNTPEDGQGEVSKSATSGGAQKMGVKSECMGLTILHRTSRAAKERKKWRGGEKGASRASARMSLMSRMSSDGGLVRA